MPTAWCRCTITAPGCCCRANASVEPMAALTAPAATAAKHQSLLHFVAIAPWSDEAVLSKVRLMALPKIEALGAIEASIIDDTGFPKKGKHSVGVARQYCGQLGKQDNCQAVVSLSVANHHASLPVAHRLYLPEVWANDPDRRKQAKVPEDIAFKTKPQIALDQLCAAHVSRSTIVDGIAVALFDGLPTSASRCL
jgi:SRSO17 transposase